MAVALVAVAVIGLAVARPWVQQPACAPVAEHPEWSVARRWDEALLDAIRRALPNPPVHARNLFHTSVAMWDAWAAYDPTASGYLVKEKHTAANVAEARDEAVSYAAYRVLTSRFIKAVGGSEFAVGVRRRDGRPVLSPRRDDDRRRFAGRRRQPYRGRRAGLRADGWLEPGRRVRLAGLRAGEPADDRREAEHRHDATRTGGSPSSSST